MKPSIGVSMQKLRPLHQAVLDALTDTPSNVMEIHLRRMEAVNAPLPWTHGVAATLAALDILDSMDLASLSKNENGASCYQRMNLEKKYEVTNLSGEIEVFTNKRKAWKRFRELESKMKPREMCSFREVSEPKQGEQGS